METKPLGDTLIISVILIFKHAPYEPNARCVSLCRLLSYTVVRVLNSNMDSIFDGKLRDFEVLFCVLHPVLTIGYKGADGETDYGLLKRLYR